jgi:hypothetical protein
MDTWLPNVIWQRTHGFLGWEARIYYGDSSFGQVEPTAAGGWQVRFFRGMRDPGPYPVPTLERGKAWLARFGAHHHERLAFARPQDLRMRPQPFAPAR